MSFLKFGNKELQIGSAVADEFRDLLNEVKEVKASQGLSYLKALEHVIQNNADLKVAGQKLLEWVRENSPESLRDLFTSLNDIEKRSKDEDRQLGWPTLSWKTKKDSDADDSADLNYGYDIEVTGGLSFDIYQDGQSTPENLPLFDTYEAVGKISIDGSLKGGVKGSLKIPVGGINANIDGEFARSVEFVYGFEDHSDLAGEAIISSLAQLTDPSNGLELLNQFNSGRMARLQGIVIDGNQGIGAGAEVTANFPSQYGTLGVKLGGKIKTSSSFNYVITRGEDSETLNLTVDTGKESSNSGSLGVSYVVGLSTLAPAAAQGLLRHVEKIHELIVDIDKKIDGYSNDKILTWLKPGHLLKDKISDKIQSFFDQHNDWDTTVIAGLSRLFGLDVDSKTTTEDALKLVNSQLSSVISELLDEIPDIFDLDSNEISEKVVKALSQSMDLSLVELLNRNIFSELKNMLDEELEKSANELDNTIHEKIEDILDNPIEDFLDGMRKFIDKVRKISKQVLDKVSQAQTDLLSAEIGWRRAMNESMGVEYDALFDFGNDDTRTSVQATYRQAVMSPSGFGELIFADQETDSITVSGQSTRYKLTKETGHRWSIAIIGFGFSNKVTKISDVQINRSPEGASIQVAGNVKKERQFWNETRRVSFVSLLNIYESANRNTEVETYKDEGKGKIVELEDNQFDPRSSASIKLSFEEEDGKMKSTEASTFLSRFVSSELLSKETEQAFIDAFQNEKTALSTNKIPATITVGLAIPSDFVLKMLEHTAEEHGIETNLQFRLSQALVKHDTEWVDEGLANNTEGMGLSDFADFESKTEAEKDEIRMDFLRMSIAEAFLAEDGMGIFGSSNRLGKAIIAFENVLKIAAEIYYEPGTPKHNAPESEWKAFRKELRKKQEKMNKHAAKYLKLGRVGPGLWGGRAPGKTIALFEAIRSVTYDITKIKPPLIITLNPEGRDPISFVELNV